MYWWRLRIENLSKSKTIKNPQDFFCRDIQPQKIMGIDK